MATYLFMWNPGRDPVSFKGYSRVLEKSRNAIPYETKWICQSGKPKPGDVAYMQRTGPTNNGFFARGTVLASTKPDGDTKRLRLRLTDFLPLGKEISRAEAIARSSFAAKWAPQASGLEIPGPIEAAIEELWAKRHSSAQPHPEQQTANPQRPAGALVPASTVASVTVYVRDQAVRTHVLQRAAGRCECCLVPAPFVDATGTPFLEVHHLVPLARGGPDTVENTTAVCPNCHRAMHLGRDAAKLTKTTEERVRAMEARVRS